MAGPATEKNARSSHPRNAGEFLARSVASQSFPSVMPRYENLKSLEEFDHILVVGSSGSGKSTLTEHLEGRVPSGVVLAQRVSTRPSRASDAARPTETLSVSGDEIGALSDAGRIGFSYVRRGTDTYAFIRPENPDELPVYVAGNSALKFGETVQPEGALSRALIVGIHAPDSVRGERIVDGRSDIDPTDLKYRIMEDPSSTMFPDAHIIVRSYGQVAEAAKDDFVKIIELAREAYDHPTVRRRG